MTETRAPFHYGGPLGLGALVAVAGAAGVYLYTNNGPEIVVETDHPIPVVVATADPVKVTIDTQTPPATEAEPEVVTVEAIVPPALKKVETPRPSPSIKPQVRPRPIPTLTPKPRVEAIPAQAKGAEVTFIVRIKGSEDIDQAARLFKKDRPQAIRAFSQYVESAPALKDFKLVGGSYSGEIRLAYILPPGKKPDRATINKIKSTIMSVDGVSYADPDFVAHPGKE